MPSWGEVVNEIQVSAHQRGALGPDVDSIRLKYIRQIQATSKRAVIVYASGWLNHVGQNVPGLIVEGSDVHALMEVCHRVPERELDLVIHSPGGSAEAAEQMINYLRTRFDYIRALVPLQAKSAATMLALGCDEIVLGAHSELGPIDPQIPIPMPGGGGRYAPAHAILRDFNRAKAEIGQDINVLATWTPILHAYAGGLLEFCTQQIRLSQEIVARWLAQYMLGHDDAGIPVEERQATAQAIAEHFGSEESYDRFRTHGRPIRIEELEQLKGLRIRRLEADQALQDSVLSLYHTLDITFNSPVIKIVANHLGAQYVKANIQMIAPIEPRTGQPVQPPVGQPKGPLDNPPGQQKRRNKGHHR